MNSGVGGPVLLFDGVCNLCNRAVDFVLRRDPSGHFRFASLDSDAAIRLLERAGRLDLLGREVASPRETPPTRPADPEFQTVILLEGDRVWTRSGAALQVLRGLGGPWAVLSAILRVVPTRLMDVVYSAVARRRYRWFGRRSVCRVPTEAERSRFL